MNPFQRALQSAPSTHPPASTKITCSQTAVKVQGDLARLTTEVVFQTELIELQLQSLASECVSNRDVSAGIKAGSVRVGGVEMSQRPKSPTVQRLAGVERLLKVGLVRLVSRSTANFTLQKTTSK